MYELLVVDDETLAQIGIKSLLDYGELGIEIVGSASNGQQAWEFIQLHQPQIVITDIKMPVMDGLELVERCNSELEQPPKFIILTGFDEFEYLRRAMRSNVVDYIIKVELGEEILRETLRKAVRMVRELGTEKSGDRYAYDLLLDHTLAQLLSRSFYSEEEITAKLEEFALDLDGDAFLAVAAEVSADHLGIADHTDRHNLFLAVMNTVKTIVPKYAKGCVTAYSSNLIGIVLSFRAGEDHEEICRRMLLHIGGLGQKYFNLALRFGVGPTEPSLYGLSASFGNARRALTELRGEETLRFFRPTQEAGQPLPDQAALLQEVAGALDSFDAPLFSASIDRVAAAVLDPSADLDLAMDMVSGIVHTIISSLDSGKQMLEDTFSWSMKSYRVLYSCTQRQELESYLRQMQTVVVQGLEEYQRCPKNRLIIAAQSYIREHISEKLTLGAVAAEIGVTPNYLSSLFKKYCYYGFSDYVTFVKIRRAQQLLARSSHKVYEIADMLGFDSSYYFSTVYKKFTGFSPKETAAMYSGAARLGGADAQ